MKWKNGRSNNGNKRKQVNALRFSKFKNPRISASKREKIQRKKPGAIYYCCFPDIPLPMDFRFCSAKTSSPIALRCFQFFNHFFDVILVRR